MDGLRETARKYIEYDLIAHHAKLPEFPELRTHVLSLFLHYATEKSLPPKLREAISLAVSFMQYGLDTHEFVEGTGELRERQLTVLAGDYFSSRFYQLLSQAESVQTIKLVSQAVSEVNTIKMNIYAKTKKLLLTAEEYVRSTVDINTHLFVSFTSWMDAVYRVTCPAILRNVAECELITKELARTDPDNIRNSWVYWYILEHGTSEEVQLFVEGGLDEDGLQDVFKKYNFAGKLTDMWETKIAELHSLLRSIKSDKLAEELQRLFEPLFTCRKKTSAFEI